MILKVLDQPYYQTDREKYWYEINADDRADNIRRLCARIKPRKVLDIGAGKGSVMQRLHDAGMGEEWDSIEDSQTGLAEIRKRVGPKIHEPKELTGYRLAFEDDAFDLAILSHMLEHQEHPRVMLYEARRVARYLYVEVALRHVAFKSNLAADFTMNRAGHVNYYDRHTIRRLVQSSGWKILDAQAFITNAATYKFMKGTRGLVEHKHKKLLLGAIPRLAQCMFTFHYGMLCERTQKVAGAMPDVLGTQV